MNNGVEFVVVLIGVAVLAGLAVWALRRRGTDELHSVGRYQHRLERLEEVRRRQTGSVRIVGGTPRPAGMPPPVIGEDGRLEISSSTSPRRTFDDTGQPPPPRERPQGPPPYRRRRDVSIARMSHRPRRLGAPIAAAVGVIVLVTGLAIAGAHSRGHTNTATTTTIPRHSGTTGTTAPRQTTTTTTVPRTFTASSTSGNVVTYTLPFTSYTLTFTASSSGDCYIQITNSSGAVPYAQDLKAGTTEQLVLTGPSKVILGAPGYVTVQVDRTPVTFPTPLPAPLDIDFNAPTPATTTTTTSSTTSTT